MLTVEEKVAWLKELRNPDNKQCRGYRAKDGAECPLNILHRILEPKRYDDVVLLGSARQRTSFHHVIEMNDHQNKSFIEIADWIETNVETR